MEPIFLKDLLAQMRLEKGNHFYVTETPDGLRFTAHNPEAEKQMCLGRRIMQKRRAQLRALANQQTGAGQTAMY